MLNYDTSKSACPATHKCPRMAQFSCLVYNIYRDSSIIHIVFVQLNNMYLLIYSLQTITTDKLVRFCLFNPFPHQPNPIVRAKENIIRSVGKIFEIRQKWREKLVLKGAFEQVIGGDGGVLEKHISKLKTNERGLEETMSKQNVCGWLVHDMPSRFSADFQKEHGTTIYRLLHLLMPKSFRSLSLSQLYNFF